MSQKMLFGPFHISYQEAMGIRIPLKLGYQDWFSSIYGSMFSQSFEENQATRPLLNLIETNCFLLELQFQNYLH